MTKCLISNSDNVIQAISDDLAFVDGVAVWDNGIYHDFVNTEDVARIEEVADPILWHVFKDGVVSPPPVVEPPLENVPVSVTRRQAVQQLIIEGLDDDVEAVIASIPDPLTKKLMTVWYKDSQVFERHRPEILQVWSALGRTQRQLDETFIAAAKL